MLMSLWLAMALPAHSAEVVWLAPPDDEQAAYVAEQADAQQPHLNAIGLRAAATAWSDQDRDAFTTLDTVLQDVRSYETKFDGELVIMRDLADPIADIQLVRDESERGKLYAALAYQGFAVNRYFDTALAEDEQAAPYREELNGVTIERPWHDAVALDPDRNVTPYDIAEAPQRVNYGKVQEIVRDALPASLVPIGIPEGADLIVDGRPTEVGAAGNVKLVPGRHLVHVAKGDAVLARWDLRLAPGDSVETEVTLTDEVWEGFLAGLASGGPVPEALNPCLEALGGEVWIARPEPELTVYRVRPGAVEPVELTPRVDPSDDSADGGLSVGLAGTTGWFYDGNFYLDNPSAGHSSGTVNAGALGALAEVVMDSGMLRVGAGLHTQFTLGASHFSRYGEDAKQTRLRPYPHLLVGIRHVQATLGYQFPHHAGVGGNLVIPIGSPLELRGFGTALIPIPKARPTGPTYKPWVAGTAGVSLGLRI